MKLVAALSIAFGASIVAAQAKVAAKQEVVPQFRQNAKRTVTYFGPYKLNGTATPKPSGGMAGMAGMAGMGGMGGMGGEDTISYLVRMKGSDFCGAEGCSVLAGKIHLNFTDGTKADVSKGVYIHHVLTYDTTKNQPSFWSCNADGSPSLSMDVLGAGFVGAGDDNANAPFMYTSKDGSFPSGFYLGPQDSILATVVLVNYNKDPKDVLVAYDLEYVPGKAGTDVQTSLISATQCGGGWVINTSKEGATNTTSGKFYVKTDGTLILAKGHLHDGGVAMHLLINDEYKCSSRATYGGSIAGAATETINGMNDCNDSPIKMKKGEYFTMVSEYDLFKHPLRETTGHGETSASGVMGMFRMIWAAA